MDTISNNDISVANDTNRRIKGNKMIEKLGKFDSTEASIYHVERLYAKVNEVITELNHILEERESGIKVYEEAQDMYDNAILDVLKDKQVDVVVEPAENVLTKSLRMDKEFAEDECVRLQNELDCTRKALDKAKWWLKEIVENHRCTPISTAEMALKEITALE